MRRESSLTCKVIGSTKEGYVASKEEVFSLGGHAAGVCYEPGDFNNVLAESPNKTRKRAENCAKQGHHSVYGHCCVSLFIKRVPKFLAMLFNNQRFYNTSEKSGRFTDLSESEGTSNIEKVLYNKWKGIFEVLIHEYSNEEDIKFKSFKIKTLAQENARYLLDFQVPTSFIYTSDIRTLNYIVKNLEAFKEEVAGLDRFSRTTLAIDEFVSWFKGSGFYFSDIKREDIKLKFFRKHPPLKEEFGETFCASLEMSVACLAQAQRHRVLTYEVLKESFDRNPGSFYVPPILVKYGMVDEWIKDMGVLSEEGVFPQATLLSVVVRGNFEDLLTMGRERLCGAAQLEIMQRTRGLISSYYTALSSLRNCKGLSRDVQMRLDDMLNELEEYKDKPKCSRVPCRSPCAFGPTKALERLI